MQLAKVVGSLVSTRKSDKLDGMKILVAVPVDMDTFEEKGEPFVTIDTIGAGEGEVVMCVGGSSSRQTDLTNGKPVDNSIVAIVDSVEILGKRMFDKSLDGEAPVQAQAETGDVAAAESETEAVGEAGVLPTVEEDTADAGQTAGEDPDEMDGQAGEAEPESLSDEEANKVREYIEQAIAAIEESTSKMGTLAEQVDSEAKNDAGTPVAPNVEKLVQNYLSEEDDGDGGEGRPELRAVKTPDAQASRVKRYGRKKRK